MVGVAPKDYVADITAVWQMPAEAIYWTDPQTFGKFNLFTHQNL